MSSTFRYIISWWSRMWCLINSEVNPHRLSGLSGNHSHSTFQGFLRNWVRFYFKWSIIQDWLNITEYQRISLNITKYHCISRNIKEYHWISLDVSLNITEYQRISSQAYQGISLSITEYQGISRNITKYPWISRNIKEYHWLSLNIKEYQGISRNVIFFLVAFFKKKSTLSILRPTV